MNLRQDVGQLFLVGLAGTELDATERAWLRLIRPAGTVLFRRNIEDPAQIHALLESIADLVADGPIFHAVDVEGGLVDRLRDLIAPMPAPAAVAATRSRRLCREQAYLIGLSKAGTLGCGKHFPGLGGGALDSHHVTPIIDRTWKQLWEEDMLPFRKLHRALPF